MKKNLFLIITFLGVFIAKSQCPAVTQINYSNYTGDSVIISWQAASNQSTWAIEYGHQGFVQGTGTLITVQTTQLFVVGLQPNLLYEFYVQGNCGNQNSAFAEPLLVPGNYNIISGNVIYDSNNNGCSGTDPKVSGVTLTASSTTSSDTFSANTNSNGDFVIRVPDGSYSLTPVVNTAIVAVTPATTVGFTFPNGTNTANYDFCIIPVATLEDISVSLFPVTQARPGFNSSYQVTVKNEGTLAVTDQVTLTYQSDFMTYNLSNPMEDSATANTLSWNYTLEPFESISYRVLFTLNTPTHPVFPLMGTDIISFSASSYLNGSDTYLSNNSSGLEQTVVNSYDPNDKTCIQGKVIEPSLVGMYLDYLIRFENTGTASAINVRVKDVIDSSKFDIGSIVPLESSHNYYMSLNNANEIEFHFDNINLDFNDATNDGYILFKIKTNTSLVAGDSFDNEAQIYFDFNAPIITNTETVTVQSTASIAETTDASISLYPNPANNLVNVTAAQAIKQATVIDTTGRLVSSTVFVNRATSQQLDITDLNTGVYFVKVQSELGVKVVKVVKE